MHRVCFQLQVRPDRIDGVRGAARRRLARRCSRALAASGWRNYSLFLRDDGLLIGYFETDSIDAARAGMASRPTSTPAGRPRWPSSSWTSTDGRPDQRLPALERGLPPRGPA